jgi:hypothetical protein
VGFFLFQDHLSGGPQIMKITLVVNKVIATVIAEDRKNNLRFRGVLNNPVYKIFTELEDIPDFLS